MTLSTASPRFDYRAAPFEAIETALYEHGHVVLDRLWNGDFIRELEGYTIKSFAHYDAAYKANGAHFSAAEQALYRGNTIGLDEVGGDSTDARFFSEIERSGIAALFRTIFRGDFVIGRTHRAVRRADPSEPMGFVGLHQDGHMQVCRQCAIRSDRELTLWTPLSDCSDEERPRLLLFEGTNGNGGPPQAKIDDAIKLGSFLQDDNRMLSIAELDALFKRLYSAYDCYAPLVPIGSAILFDFRTVHGTYRNPSMTLPRYSVDFRIVGDYHVDRANEDYDVQLFRREGKRGRVSSIKASLRSTVSRIKRRVAPGHIH